VQEVDTKVGEKEQQQENDSGEKMEAVAVGAAKEENEESNGDEPERNGADEDKPEPATALKSGADEVDKKENTDERDGKKPELEENAGNSKHEDNDKTAATGLKRGADEVNTDEEEGRDSKKPKLEEDAETSKNEDGVEASGLDEGKAGDEDAEATYGAVYGFVGDAGWWLTWLWHCALMDGYSEDAPKKTLRINNFVRPFTLNAVKVGASLLLARVARKYLTGMFVVQALVQEFGDFVEDGFWMDTIKTHCYVTYNSVEIVRWTLLGASCRLGHGN
jgi:hypothetical protein